MVKSQEYKKNLDTLLIYYYNELLKEGNADPIQTIITDFVNSIEITTKQKRFIEDETSKIRDTLIDVGTFALNIVNNRLTNNVQMNKDDLLGIKTVLEMMIKELSYKKPV